MRPAERYRRGNRMAVTAGRRETKVVQSAHVRVVSANLAIIGNIAYDIPGLLCGIYTDGVVTRSTLPVGLRAVVGNGNTHSVTFGALVIAGSDTPGFGERPVTIRVVT